MAQNSGWRMVGDRWTRSLGVRGLRVRLFQKRRHGVFYRTLWLPGEGKDRKCLGTKDRREAERLGRALLTELRTAGVDSIPADRESTRSSLTLGDLWRRYRTTCPAFLDNASTSQQDAHSRAQVLLAYFGVRCLVESLTVDDQAAYANARRAGGIRIRNGELTGAVRARSAEADLVLLHQMLRWATTVRVDGVPLLRSNPLAGVRRVREQDPKRPIATWDRYQATRAALRELAAQAESGADRVRWIKVELALVLAEATGRRLGSIRQLRWEDIDWTAGTVRWRAGADKKRREAIVPLPVQLLDQLRAFQKELRAVGGLVFGAEHDTTKAMDRHLFDKWLAHAEKKAGLKKLDGGLWHPYRRKWATERKHLSVTDVAEAGGWKDTVTLLTYYARPDNETLLAVMSEERKLRDCAVGSRNGPPTGPR
jgi:integrase